MLKSPKFTIVVLTIAANTIMATGRNATSRLLRGHSGIDHQNLFPHPKSGHQSTYKGCLGYSDSELSDSWSFSSQAPRCSWVHSWKSSSNSSVGGSSGLGYNDNDDIGNGNTQWGGDDGRYSNTTGDDRFTYIDSSIDDDHNGAYGVDSDDKTGNQESYNDDEIVVTNEDTYSGDSEFDPIEDFVIRVVSGTCKVFCSGLIHIYLIQCILQCDTYENLWLWDLSLSCNSTEGELALNGCSCTFAEELMDNGLLACDDVALCPDDCLICATCMKLMGCESDPDQPGTSRLISTSTVLFIIAAAVALLIFALVAHYTRRKWKGNQEWSKSLLEKQKDESGPSFMYINGDLTWKPLPSDQEYAAQQIQPICTMSTASTGKFLEERAQPGVGENFQGNFKKGKQAVSDRERHIQKLETPTSSEGEVPIVVEALDDIEYRVVSPMQTSEDSSNEKSYIFEDAVQSPIS